MRCQPVAGGCGTVRNGALEASGVGSAFLDYLARSVAWLATTLADLDQWLEANHLVLSGSLTRAVDVEPGDVISAEITSVGSFTTQVGNQ